MRPSMCFSYGPLLKKKSQSAKHQCRSSAAPISSKDQTPSLYCRRWRNWQTTGIWHVRNTMSNAAPGHILQSDSMYGTYRWTLHLFLLIAVWVYVFYGVLFHELHDVLHACHSATLHAIFHVLRKACYNLWKEVVDHVGGTFGQLLQITRKIRQTTNL